jgi:hypothetical protein
VSELEKQFYDYLVAHGKKEYTASGRRSTVYSYCNRINKNCERESMTWEQLAESIETVLPQYDVGGAEEDYGMSSSKTPINALWSFADFVKER